MHRTPNGFPPVSNRGVASDSPTIAQQLVRESYTAAVEQEQSAAAYYARETERQNAMCICAHPVYTHYKRGQGCTRCKCRQLVFDCRPPEGYVPPDPQTHAAREAAQRADEAELALAARGWPPMAGGSGEIISLPRTDLETIARAAEMLRAPNQHPAWVRREVAEQLQAMLGRFDIA